MKGFTLVEVMVSSCIFLVLIFAVFTLMSAGRNAWFIGDVSVELRQDIIKSILTMEKELKATRPAQISLPVATSCATLNFTMPYDIDGDGTVLNSTTGYIEWSSNVTYALNADNQITRTDANATAVLANNINSLLFTRPATPLNLIQVDITAQKTSKLGRVVQDAGQLIIKMRN